MALDYRNKIIMAPMVRIGTLPMRLLALRYGADLVYSEELVDWKFLRCQRKINEVLGTIDYVDPADGNVTFRTCEEEKGKVVFQMGTSNVERAVKLAQLVQDDVAAIDVNMGCPKEFSVKGGMGVALMANLELAKKVLTALVAAVKIPVTCKIRVLKSTDETIRVVKELESTGISAIAIHGRTKDERPQHNVNPDIIKAVAAAVKIPVIANGGSKEIQRYRDISKFREAAGVSSVMLARAIEWNCSILRKDGLLPLQDVIKEYLKICVEYDNHQSNTKYCVQNMLRELQESDMGKKFLDAQTMEQLCDVWDLKDFCREKQKEFQKKKIENNRNRKLLDEGSIAKRIKLDPSDVIEKNLAFIRCNFLKDTDLPKTLLHVHINNVLKCRASYITEQNSKLFRSIITVQGKKYSSTFWEKNKKNAEQGAALVCLLHLGLVNEKDLIENGTMIED